VAGHPPAQANDRRLYWEFNPQGEERAVKVSVKLFALVRETVGFDEITVNLSNPSATVSDLREAMVEQYPGLSAWMPFSQVAVNQEVAADDQQLQPTDEIAILPPFSGG